ncbi:MAG TPA: hypothetical protein VFR80_08645, partial [Pyrinomonadaceae bacterium]|nr:hypothetical protein [Pyrinomonadaceae bacterium]
DPQRVQLMTERTDRALAVAAGIMFSISAPASALVRETPARFSLNLSNSGNRTVQIMKLTFEGWGDNVPLEAADVLSADSETITPVDLVTPAKATITVPKAEHLYDGRVLGHRFAAHAQLEIDGAKFSVKAQKSLDVVPAVEIANISPSPCVGTDETVWRCQGFKVTLINHLGKPFAGGLTYTTTQGQNVRENTRQIALAPLETRAEGFSNSDSRPPRETIRQERQSGSVVVSINPPNLRAPAFDRTHSISTRTVNITYVDARVAKALRVGYVPSFDKTLEQSLDALGVPSEKLTVDQIQEGALTSYKTIILDNRAYYAHPELIRANSRLFSFVQEGGTLVVFYHKDSEWNPNPDRGRPQLAPYPIILGDERVTEEVAPIKFLQPRHAILNYPNKIRSADFNNWIQERGLYYPKEWDSQYTALLASNDKGEKPLRGGLLVARYGRGNYIFTSMVWYRQLAAGVPGAYRMLANMISYGH